LPSIDRPNGGLTVCGLFNYFCIHAEIPIRNRQSGNLKKELEHEYSNDDRFGPLLHLLSAVESPDIDYYSPEVQDIIGELHTKLKDDPKTSQPDKKFEVVPFFPDGEAIVADIKLAANAVFDKILKPFHHLQDPSIQQVIGGDDFKNWGKDVSFKSGHTLVVRSIDGVCKVVKWAAAQGKKVRVAGFRHSWRYDSHCAHYYVVNTHWMNHIATSSELTATSSSCFCRMTHLSTFRIKTRPPTGRRTCLALRMSLQ
jgi:hypothetical protein